MQSACCENFIRQKAGNKCTAYYLSGKLAYRPSIEINDPTSLDFFSLPLGRQN